MRKLFLLISVFALFGCNKIEEKNSDYIEHVNYVFQNKNDYVNVSADGYKYYLPIGVTINKSKNSNTIFKVDNTSLYLFVDKISYFYKNKNSLLDFKKYDYYKQLENNGYLVIDENNQTYFVKLYYNYSSIEFYTAKKNISKLLTYSSIILNSIKYNDVIIEKEISNNTNYDNEKLYLIEELEKDANSFSKYLNSDIEEKNENIKLPE